MRDFFSYTGPVMYPGPKPIGETWPRRVVLWGLLVAVAALSLEADLDIEIAVHQSNHSLVGKVYKDPRQSHGGQKDAALSAALFHWAPSFHSYFLVVADQQNAPALRLLKSVVIRAPPVAYSV